MVLGDPRGDGEARLSWPVARLQALGEKLVELEMTLSDFIEPSPAQLKADHVGQLSDWPAQ